MSHVAEVYAKDLGVKIGDAQITDHFFPNLMDNYIYFNPHGDYPAQEYAYWDVVFSLLREPLEKNKIEILTAPTNQQITVKQNNFLIKKSLLYVGTASHRVQISDIYNIPSVCVLGNMYESNFSKFKYAEVLTPDFSKIKPSFGSKENINRVNEIKPEQICEIILAQLEIEYKLNFNTFRIGQTFNNATMEIVPNFFQPYEQIRGKAINIRSDIHFDLQMITNWCQFCVVNLYLNDPLENSVVSNLPNLKQIIFKYRKDHDDNNLLKFFKTLKRYKKNLIIEVSDKDILSDVRLKYFDYPVILKEPPKNISVPDNCQFVSNKQFVTNGEFYASESSAKRLDKSKKFVYDEISKLEIESLYLYVQK